MTKTIEKKGLGFEVVCKAKDCEHHDGYVSCNFQGIEDPVIMIEGGRCHNFKSTKNDHFSRTAGATDYFKERKARGSEDFLEAKKLLVKAGLDPEILGTDEYSTSFECVNSILCTVSIKMSLIKGLDPEELDKVQLIGITDIINETYKLIDVAFSLAG